MAQLDVDVDSTSFDIRRIYSGGESVGASTVEWVEETFGTPVLEHYGFTEGGMLVNNYPLRGGKSNLVRWGNRFPDGR